METAANLWETKDCHCLAARRRARELTRLYEEKLRPHGLRATQFSILAVLALKGDTLVSELAEVLTLERTTVTRSATVVKRNGWIEEAPTEDARKRPLRLTASGRAKLQEAYPAWREVQDVVDREGGARRGSTPATRDSPPAGR